MAETVKPQLASHDHCTGCGACASGCPKGAVHMVRDKEGFLYPQITDGCVGCGHCAHVCPALKQREVRSAPAVFAVWNEDEAVRAHSTAGGVFTALAEFALECGGVVFGAALDEKLQVRHIVVKNKEDLRLLRGAKPIQSELGETYQQVQMYLEQRRFVLFCGTPCQVDGLYRFLGEHPENLLTCDFACSGVGSPGVWARFVESMAYLKRRRLCLRPGCYRCAYANTNRPGDLTMTVFHTIPKDFQPQQQKAGMSLLLINSVKGAHIFDQLPLKREPRTLEEAVADNAALRAAAVQQQAVALRKVAAAFCESPHAACLSRRQTETRSVRQALDGVKFGHRYHP